MSHTISLPSASALLASFEVFQARGYDGWTWQLFYLDALAKVAPAMPGPLAKMTAFEAQRLTRARYKNGVKGSSWDATMLVIRADKGEGLRDCLRVACGLSGIAITSIDVAPAHVESAPAHVESAPAHVESAPEISVPVPSGHVRKSR